VAAVAYIELTTTNGPVVQRVGAVRWAIADAKHEVERVMDENGPRSSRRSPVAVDPPGDHWGSADSRGWRAYGGAR
jgi:hypothetical protein